jgi:hypothetical protein
MTTLRLESAANHLWQFVEKRRPGVFQPASARRMSASLRKSSNGVLDFRCAHPRDARQFGFQRTARVQLRK